MASSQTRVSSQHQRVTTGTAKTTKSAIRASSSRTWTATHVHVTNFSHIWTIDNFLLCDAKTGQSLKSATFSSETNPGVKWGLKVFPSGESKGLENYVSLFLRLLTSDKDKITAKFKFFLTDSTNGPKNVREVGYDDLAPGHRWGVPRFIERRLLIQEAKNLLPNNTLTINCIVTVVGDTITVSSKCGASPKNSKYVSQNLESALYSKKFSDVTLVAGGKEFHAHKIILSVASPVFNAMFEHDTKEAREDLVEIEDVHPKEVAEMLRFVYTGSVPNLDKMAADLLRVADKYGIELLKEQCEEALLKNITVGTAAHTLVLSHLHSALGLKSRVIKFINRNAHQVVKSGHWEEVLKHQGLMKEVFQDLAENQVFLENLEKESNGRRVM